MIVSERARAGASALLSSEVALVLAPSNDAWARDTGATFVVAAEGAMHAIDWRFNAWGGLYPDFGEDDRIAARMADREGVAAIRAPLVMEGGAIHGDGEGTAITTRSCLLDPKRNPDVTAEAVERVFRELLGVTRVIWLEEGVPEDETGGHIDNLLAFAAPGQLLLSWCDDPNDPHYQVSRQAFETLRGSVDAQGRSFEITRLPMPGPLYSTPAEVRGLAPLPDGGYARRAGQRLAASYANFYIANEAVIMPLLDPRTDAAAAERLKTAFPGRRLVGIESREILLGGGNIHCITQQVPFTAHNGR